MRLPLIQGVTFAAVGPMITIGVNHGVTTIYGSVIACGLFMIALAPVFGRLIRFFPPLVTGTRHHHPDHRRLADAGGGRLVRRRNGGAGRLRIAATMPNSATPAPPRTGSGMPSPAV